MTSNTSIRYSKIFPRFSSYFIDQVLIGVIIGLFAGAFSWLTGRDSYFEENFYAYFIISLVYYSLFISGRWQATPGMRMIGIYVADNDKQKLDIFMAAIRYVLFVANLIVATLLAIFFAKLLSAIFLCNNESNSILNIFGPDGKMQLELFSLTAQVKSKTLEMIFGASLLFKLLVIAFPMFVTKKRQTLYDYLAKICVIKGERL